LLVLQGVLVVAHAVGFLVAWAIGPLD
jgi:hypothetical protein